MADNIVLKTYKGGNVTPQDDAIIYETAVPGSGIFKGCEVTYARGNVLHISQGFGMIRGRFFEVYETEIDVRLADVGETLDGRVYIHLDLSNTDEPIKILAQAASELPPLDADVNINYNNSSYDLELAIFTVSSAGLSGLTKVFPTLKGWSGGGGGGETLTRATSYSVGDAVTAVGAPGWATFVCTQAGTTAAYEPSGYSRVTNGGIYGKEHHRGAGRTYFLQCIPRRMERRRNMDARYSSVSIFSSKIKCSECGNWYGSKVWHSQDKYRRVIFQCNRRFKNDKKCRTPHLTEDEIKDAFVKAVNAVIPEKDELIANTKVMMRTLCDTTELEVERSRLLTESAAVVEIVKRIVAENQTTATDQEEYQRRRNELVARYESAKEGYGRVSDEISERQRKRKVYMRFIGGLQRLDGFCKEFDEELWTSLLDHATVYTKDDIRFTFKVGDEVKVTG